MTLLRKNGKSNLVQEPDHAGYLIPSEFLPPGGIKALPAVINGPIYQLYESGELARDDSLRTQAVSLRSIYGVKTPIIEGMSLQDTLRMRELMGVR